MGNFVAVGSMCAFAFSVTLLPAFCQYYLFVPGRCAKIKQGFSIVSVVFVISHRMILLYSFGALTILLVAGISRIELKENWLEALDESYEFRRSANFLNENFPGVETYEYPPDSGREGGVTDIEYLKQVDAFAEWYRGNRNLSIFSQLPTS